MSQAHAQDLAIHCTGERIKATFMKRNAELTFAGNISGMAVKGLMYEPSSEMLLFEGWFDPLPSTARGSAFTVRVNRLTGEFHAQLSVQYQNNEIKRDASSGNCKKVSGDRLF